MNTIRSRYIIAVFVILLVFGLFYVSRNVLSDYYVKRADIFYGQNKTDEALTGYLFADALGERSGSSSAKIQRAQVFYAGSDLSSAEKEISQVLKADKNNPQAIEFMGDIKHRQEKFSEAEKYYDRAYGLNHSSDYLINKIRNLVREGKTFDAQESLGGASKDFPEAVSYYLGLVDFNKDGKFPLEFEKMDSGKYAREISIIHDFCQSSSEINGSDSDYELVGKADIFNKINEPDFARLDLYSVIRKNDKYCDAYITLGKSFLISDDYDKSADAFEKCLNLDVNNTQSLFWLSEIYGKTGDNRKAQDYKERYEYLVK